VCGLIYSHAHTPGLYPDLDLGARATREEKKRNRADSITQRRDSLTLGISYLTLPASKQSNAKQHRGTPPSDIKMGAGN